MSDLDEFVSAYIECALWAGIDWSGGEGFEEPLDANYDYDDLAPETLATIMNECEQFLAANRDSLDATDATMDQHGHDFYLTRHHHGAGFWDRGYGNVGDTLTVAAQTWSESKLYVGDDGKLYI